MSKKYSVLLGIIVGVFIHSQAYANPASTEYVRSAIDALRTELNSQTNARFNEISALIKQLTVALNQSNNQNKTQNSQANSRIDDIQKQFDALPIVTHQVGELFQGGLVFYVDSTLQHGLVVSLTDLGEPIQWRNGEGGDRVTNAKGQGLGSGETNTRLVISEQTIDQQDGDFAALRASNYHILSDGKSPCPTTLNATKPCYGGWYLPSIYELVLLQSAFNQLGDPKLNGGVYWSSTEVSATQAFSLDMLNGEVKILDKFNDAAVRPIHSF